MRTAILAAMTTALAACAGGCFTYVEADRPPSRRVTVIQQHPDGKRTVKRYANPEQMREREFGAPTQPASAPEEHP